MRGLLFLATALPAVELPITSLVIQPDGAVVERRGRLDGTPVTGFPTDATDLVVMVEGIAVPRWSWSITTPPEAHDTQARERDRLAAEITAGETALTRAIRRRELAARAAEDPPEVPGAPAPALPAPGTQAALRQFLDTNAATALTEEAAARARRDAAVAALAALNQAPAPVSPTGVVTIAGPAGAAVVLRHRVPGLRWGAAYRLEVRERDATLVLLAQIDDARGQNWGTIPVICDARSPRRNLTMPALNIPLWGASEAVSRWWDPVEPGQLVEMETEMGGAGAFMAIGSGGGGRSIFGSSSSRKSVVLRCGGSKGSESSVGTSLTFLRNQQATDGHLGEAPWQADLTARATLMFLGAGYDHRSPNKFRTVVQAQLAWLSAQDPKGLGYSALARSVAALAEAQGMTGDGDLKATIERQVAVLQQRIATDLPGESVRSGPFAGPEAVISSLLAAKSLIAAGLPERGLMQSLRPFVARLDDGTDAGFSAFLLAEVLFGRHPEVSLSRLEALIHQIDRHLDRGEVSVLEHATQGLFQVGGPVWARWNQALRDRLVARQQGDGSWVGPHPAGRLAMTLGATAMLEVYYRYAQVVPRSPPRARAPEPLADVARAARGWPLVWHLPTASLGRGRSEVEVARLPLAGAVAWTAMPTQASTVWRHLEARNSLVQPLPEGPCTLDIDGDERGSTPLPFTAPGALLRLPLGSDERLRVERTAQSTSDDGWRRREVTADLALRLTAPTGFTGTVTALEPLPRLADEDLRLEVLTPTISDEEMARRRRDDPFWHLPLTVAAPTATVSYRLRWPKDKTPVLEYAR